MHYFDLNPVLALESLAGKMKNAMVQEAFAALGPSRQIEDADHGFVPIAYGRQITTRRRLAWRATEEGSALVIEADLFRYICPTAGTIDGALRLGVRQISRLAPQARILLLALLPLIGIVIGLAGWFFLQSDTSMTAPPWAVAGAILGAICGLLVMPVFTHRLGALMEGQEALNGERNRRAAEEAAVRTVERLIEECSAESVLLGRQHESVKFEAVTPETLAVYADELLDQPDAAILRYGLFLPANREKVGRAFARLNLDPRAFKAYQEARKSAL